MIKTFVSILGFMTIVAFSTSNVDVIKDYCSCEGVFCACDAECDNGELPECACGFFSCSCNCYGENSINNDVIQDEDQHANVTISERQAESSKDFEKFLKAQNNDKLNTLATMVKECREALIEKDMKKYHSVAPKAEKIISNLEGVNRVLVFGWLIKLKITK